MAIKVAWSPAQRRREPVLPLSLFFLSRLPRVARGHFVPQARHSGWRAAACASHQENARTQTVGIATQRTEIRNYGMALRIAHLLGARLEVDELQDADRGRVGDRAGADATAVLGQIRGDLGAYLGAAGRGVQIVEQELPGLLGSWAVL